MPAQVTAFVVSNSPTKRADLIETLFADPQWLDKWTMYFGDQFKAASSFPSSGTQLYPGGRDGLNTYIRTALTNNTGYDKMALAFIASQGTNNYTQGELNWLITSRVTGGPTQDVWDGEAAAVAETFLGISHMNCLLCHNGRGHLDSISLWAGNFHPRTGLGHVVVLLPHRAAQSGARFHREERTHLLVCGRCRI